MAEELDRPITGLGKTISARLSSGIYVHGHRPTHRVAPAPAGVRITPLTPTSGDYGLTSYLNLVCTDQPSGSATSSRYAAAAARSSLPRSAAPPFRYTARVELLNFLLIFACGYLLLRHPDRERLAFSLALASVALTIFLFLVGTRTSLLPGLNY